MNTPTIFKCTVMLAVLAAVGAGVPAQERGKEQPRATRSLIEQLGHRDFEQREAAEKRLLELGKAARAQLERAAKDHEDAEVRWRAQRILRKLDRGETGERRLRRRQPADRDRDRDRVRVDEVDRVFEEVLRRLERDLDIDIKNVRRHLERARSEARDRARDLDIQSERQSRSMKMSITPDGVRVETEEADRDGKVSKKVYEAEDIEAFKSKYPEVAKRFGIGGSGIRIFRGQVPDLEDFGLRRWSWPQRDPLDKRIRQQLEEHRRRHQELMGRLQRLHRLQPPVARPFEKEQQEKPQVEAPPAGERLGIYASDAPADVAEFLGLEKGQGLQVEEVIKGSLAERLGIQKGDILFQIGDRKIFAVEDVRKALRPIKAGASVHVQVNRRGRVLALEARKPAVAGEKKKAPNKLKQRGKLRRR
jgi:hypothetical protein